MALPDDFSGKSVLDIGAWDGAYSFAAERRGASRVVAVDSFCWNGEGWGTQDGFHCARRLLGSQVEDLELEKWTPKPGQRLKWNLHRVSGRRAEAGCAEVHHIWRPPTK